MTIEELKEEANRLGYNIIKKYERYTPCKCGANSRHVVWKDGLLGLKCSKCGFTVFAHNDKIRLCHMKKIWNDTLKEE